MYVVEKILWKAQAAEPDDLIRVEKISSKTGKVTLQPWFKDKYVVSLRNFRKDYKIV